ncbi:MAG: glycosyltransferase family A protein [Mobilitalea sp.]
MFRKRLVSVILPIYNGEKYLREAMDSIINQTYHNIEIIIINDGSKDDTLSIIDEYRKQDDRIVLISRENRGLVASLNEGIKMAKGEYIARMDADDIAHLDRFEKQVDYLNRHKDIFLLGSNYNLIYEGELSEERRKRHEGTHRRSQAPIDSSNSFLSTNETMKFIHPTIMMRKELFDIVGLYRDFKIEDLELYFRVGAMGLGIAKIEEPLLEYRAREDSKSWADTRAEQSREIMETKLEFLSLELEESIKSAAYMIWGADISGDIACELIQKRMPQSKCLAYIDPYKEGELRGIPIIHPDNIVKYEFDYIYICTQAGAVSARKLLNNIGLKEIEQYFKIS